MRPLLDDDGDVCTLPKRIVGYLRMYSQHRRELRTTFDEELSVDLGGGGGRSSSDANTRQPPRRSATGEEDASWACCGTGNGFGHTAGTRTIIRVSAMTTSISGHYPSNVPCGRLGCTLRNRSPSNDRCGTYTLGMKTGGIWDIVSVSSLLTNNRGEGGDGCGGGGGWCFDNDNGDDDDGNNAHYKGPATNDDPPRASGSTAEESFFLYSSHEKSVGDDEGYTVDSCYSQLERER